MGLWVILLVKGRLRTFSSSHESRKFKQQKKRNGASTYGVLYLFFQIAMQLDFLLLCAYKEHNSIISAGVGWLELLILLQGNARARGRDERE